METPEPANSTVESPEAKQARINAGRYRGLVKAVAARRADRSEFYAPNFSNGFLAFDLERSAAAAGEDRAELRRHLALFDRILLPLSGFLRGFDHAATARLPLSADASSPRPLKLARALARLAWYMLRLFFTQARWERRAVCYRLQELAAWRRRHGPLTLERLNQFKDALDRILGQHLWEAGKLEKLWRRFKHLWELLFEAPETAPAAPAGPALIGPEASGGAHARLDAEARAAMKVRLSAEPEVSGSVSCPLSPGADGEAASFPNAGCGAGRLDIHFESLREQAEHERRLRLLGRVDRYGPEELSIPFQPPSRTHQQIEDQRGPAGSVRRPEGWLCRAKAGAGSSEIEGGKSEFPDGRPEALEPEWEGLDSMFDDLDWY